MNIQKQIAIAEHRGEFDLAETLKGFDQAEQKTIVCEKCAKVTQSVIYQRMVNRARNTFTRLATSL